jgi:tetratricopeptide (TPR) repeat protein
LADLEMVTKKSIPHQSLHWNGRRLKGKYYLETGEFKKAIFELKLFTSKKFKPEDSNKKYSEEALSDYGKALLESGEFSEAINVFNKALEVEENQKEPKAEQLLYRGIARQKAGQSGFVKDFKEAAKLGSEKATEMLESIA